MKQFRISGPNSVLVWMTVEADRQPWPFPQLCFPYLSCPAWGSYPRGAVHSLQQVRAFWEGSSGWTGSPCEQGEALAFQMKRNQTSLESWARNLLPESVLWSCCNVAVAESWGSSGRNFHPAPHLRHFPLSTHFWFSETHTHFSFNKQKPLSHKKT